jgi:hypothetical protein
LRYFFHYRNPTQYIRDGEGDELADLAAAREEGRCSARELMGLDRGEPSSDYAGGVFEISLADDTIVAITEFSEQSLGD